MSGVEGYLAGGLGLAALYAVVSSPNVGKIGGLFGSLAGLVHGFMSPYVAAVPTRFGHPGSSGPGYTGTPAQPGQVPTTDPFPPVPYYSPLPGSAVNATNGVQLS